jgi:hypothetical protein
MADLKRFEIYSVEEVPAHVRDAQRALLLYLTSGEEIWVATARAVGLDPVLECDSSTEARLTTLGMRWLQDPEIEALTDQIQRVATASMRLLRLRAVREMGKFLSSPIEGMRYKAARDILKSTDPDIERLRGVGKHSAPTHPETGPRTQRVAEEHERMKLRRMAKKAITGGD